MISRSITARLMAPLLISMLLLAILAGVTLRAQHHVAQSQTAAWEAEQKAFALSEIRSLSRSLQRDSLNLIFEADAAERDTIKEKLASRSAKMADDLRSIEDASAEGGIPRAYFATQHAVLHELAAVAQTANAGDTGAALARFKDGVRPAERTGSKIADAQIKTLNEQVATLKVAASDATRNAEIVLLVSTLVLSVSGLVAGLLITRKGVVRPLHQLRASMERLAQGETTCTIPHEERADEVGQMARSMSMFRDQLAAAEHAKLAQTALIVDSIGKGLSHLAEGDLVSRVEVELTGPFAQLKADFNAAAAALQDVMAQMAEAATGIDTGAAEIRHASDDLSRRTERQAASLEETAAAMDAITSTVRRTAERASQASTAVTQARSDADHSAAVVRDAVAAMGGIERTSHEINDIIAVIDGIAFQTNLLALNAGVEAARAGESGKGFAVVASEVRALAQRSADAAKDVKARITASTSQVAIGAQLVGETGQALGRIAERIELINGLVTEIASSAEQQAAGVQQVSAAMSEMDGVTQQNAAMVEQATAAARNLANDVGGMTRQIARFRTGAAPTTASSEPRRPKSMTRLG